MSNLSAPSQGPIQKQTNLACHNVRETQYLHLYTVY